MSITVILYGILREKLPPEAKGQAELAFPAGATVQDVMDQLNLPREVTVTVNEEIVRDRRSELDEGDLLRFLRPSKGG